jgi:predicted Zn-dependent peptidase
MKLRESMGLAFDAFSEFEIYQSTGIFWAKARVTPESVSSSIEEMIREIRSLATNQIAPAEIEEAKSYLIGNLPLQFEAPASFAFRIARMAALNLRDDHWSGAAENLMRVSAPRVSEVARKCFLGVPLIIVVGPKEPLLDLLSNNFVSVELYDQYGVHVQTTRQGEIK